MPAFRARLLEAGVLDEEAALRIEEEADQQVTAAVTYATDSPDPTPDQLFAHAYASPVPNTPRQLPGDLARREIGDLDMVEPVDGAAIVADPARFCQRKSGAGEEGFRVFLQAAL